MTPQQLPIAAHSETLYTKKRCPQGLEMPSSNDQKDLYYDDDNGNIMMMVMVI
jgi:hypothetical protein